MDETDRPALLRDIALANSEMRGGAVGIAMGAAVPAGGYVLAGGLENALFVMSAFAGLFIAVVAGLFVLNGARERLEARRQLRELDRVLPEARVVR